MKKVLLLDNVHESAKELFESAGYFVEKLPISLEQDDLVSKIREGGFNILGIRSKTVVDQYVLEECPTLEVVGSFCIGTDKVDKEFAAQKAVVSFNEETANTRSVAEKVIATIIAQASGIAQRNVEMHKGMWNKTAVGCHEVRGKKLGIIGYGNIGSQVSDLAENFGMDVVFYDSKPVLARGNATREDSMEAVLEKSDFITLHVSGDKENEGLITLDHIKMMKESAYFINYARAFAVEERALINSLREEVIRGIATDVFLDEPKTSKAEFNNPLKEFNNAILTPHTGASTEEAQAGIAKAMFGKINNYYKTGSIQGSVNFPEVSAHVATNKTRISFIHLNKPGVMKEMLEIIGSYSLNISGQVLGTRGDIGYCIFDLDGKMAKDLVDEIVSKSFPGKVKISEHPVF